MSFRAGRFTPGREPRAPGRDCRACLSARTLPESLPGGTHVTQGPPLHLAGPPCSCAAGSYAYGTATRQ
eukprot:9025049-Alexandrium_andersonii.AAC.1